VEPATVLMLQHPVIVLYSLQYSRETVEPATVLMLQHPVIVTHLNHIHWVVSILLDGSV